MQPAPLFAALKELPMLASPRYCEELRLKAASPNPILSPAELVAASDSGLPIF
jgi:hypothetical protein